MLRWRKPIQRSGSCDREHTWSRGASCICRRSGIWPIPVFLPHTALPTGASAAKRSDAVALIRVNFHPASAIKVPDVSGSIYLDARRFVVRRAVFEMTHSEAPSPPSSVSASPRPSENCCRSCRSLIPPSRSSLCRRSSRQERVLTSERPAEEQVALGSDRLLGFAFDGEAPGERRPPSRLPPRASTRPPRYLCSSATARDRGRPRRHASPRAVPT